jgi:hypothetical protein
LTSTPTCIPRRGRDALAWMFASGLLVPGTVLGYDDFYDIACVANSASFDRYGEARAHAEFAAKHQVRFRCLCGAYSARGLRQSQSSNLRPYFVIESIGRGSTGVELSQDEVASLVMKKHPY